jgi:hypothetical protein
MEVILNQFNIIQFFTKTSQRHTLSLKSASYWLTSNFANHVRLCEKFTENTVNTYKFL